MFRPDKAIESIEDDELERKDFAESLGDAILKSSTIDSLVVGINGPWGSGKTSVVNMMIEHIEDSTNEDGKTPIIIKFNPWNFSEQNQLIEQFFNQMSLALGKEDNSDRLKKVSGLLKMYSKLLKPTAFIPVIGQATSIVADVSGFVGDTMENAGEHSEKSLSEIKEDLSTLLVKEDTKIIVVVDDIDRLNDLEIRQTFQLVKSLADFPNTVYLLTFDREVIKKALEKDQEGDGERYLEKIVQIPILIPPIPMSKVEEILLRELNDLTSGISYEESDRTHWDELNRAGFPQFFENIRDVTRYINVLKFYFEFVKEEVNQVDFFGITAIQVFFPKIYQKIRDNKLLFVEMSDFILQFDAKESEDDYERILELAENKYHDFLLGFLKVLFPKINKIYHNLSGPDEVKLRKERRICSENVFDIYFKLSLPEEYLSKSEIKLIIDSGGKTEVSQLLLKLIENGKIFGFLEVLPGYADKILEDNIEPTIAAIMDVGDSVLKRENDYYGTDRKILFAIKSLRDRLQDQNDRFNVLKHSMEESTNSLYPTVLEVDALYELYGKYDSRAIAIPENELPVNSEQLEALKEIALKKIEDWMIEGKLETHREIIRILFLWKQWGGNQQKAADWIDDILSDDDRLIHFVSCHTIERLSFNESPPQMKLTVNFEPIEHFMDLKVVEEKLKDMSSSGVFENKSKKEKASVELFLETVDEYMLRKKVAAL